jgi:hypothetical protein
MVNFYIIIFFIIIIELKRFACACRPQFGKREREILSFILSAARPVYEQSFTLFGKEGDFATNCSPIGKVII